MSHFKQLDFTKFDLASAYSDITDLTFGREDTPGGQVCINTQKGHEDDPFYGYGGLWKDWQNQKTITYDNGTKETIVPWRKEGLKEQDFNVVCEQFKGTIFEEAYEELNSKFILGRVRLMTLASKRCLTWHKDTSPRIHYPFITELENFMIIEDEVKHLPNNTWWLTDTTHNHTALNGSTKDRIHLVAVLLGKRLG
jgi:hypothetical protein